MAGVGKLVKFEEIGKMSIVFQNSNWHEPQLTSQGKNVEMKGHWRSKFFKNENPIVLELACGYGEYTLAMAKKYPNKNFIGIDVKGNRIWTGAKEVLAEGLDNAGFMRISIELITHFFEQGEVDEIWIPFPDPFLRECKAQKRLTSSRFLALYKQIIKKDAMLHLKTDSTPLYLFTQETLESEGHPIWEDYSNLYEEERENDLLLVKTRYEKINPSKSSTIKYLRFSLSFD